jgi:hypothetical protein
MPREFREYTEDEDINCRDLERRNLSRTNDIELRQPTVEADLERNEQQLTETEKAQLDTQLAEIIDTLETTYPTTQHQEQHCSREEIDSISVELVKQETHQETEKILDIEECKERMTIESPEALDELLSHHPHLCAYPGFREVYRQARLFVELKAAQERGALLDVTPEDLAEPFSLPKETLSSWLDGKYEPVLIKTLRAHEERQQQEVRLETPPTTPTDEKPTSEREKIKEQHLSPTDTLTSQSVSQALSTSKTSDTIPIIDTPSIFIQEHTPIRDSVALDAELEKFPHIYNRHNYQQLRETTEKYFQALQYQGALTRSEITFTAIATKIADNPRRVRRWLIEGNKPQLLRILDRERTYAATIEKLKQSEAEHLTSTDEIIHAADNPKFRNQLLPLRELTHRTFEILLSLRRQEVRDTLNPTSFTRISDLATYEKALCAFPLIQSHPRFDKLHRQVKLYFQIRDDQPSRLDERLPIIALAEYAGVDRVTIYNWLNGIMRPSLLVLLEQRASTLIIHQKRVTELREIDSGIRTFEDFVDRLTRRHFIFSEKFQANTNFPKHINDAARYLRVLNLVEAGYHPRDLAIHFKLNKETIGQTLRLHQRPYAIRLAVNIPEHSPDSGLRWLPTLIDDSEVPARFIQAPYNIREYKQLLHLLMQLVALTETDPHFIRQLSEFGPDQNLLKQWTSQFGPIKNLENKIHAFGYIIGTALSDGHIAQESTYSSQFKIELSTAYSWSKIFGDRAAYYLTSLGIPTKPGADSPAKPPEKPNPTNTWYSIKTPLLTWVNETVLGFKPGQTHTDTPAKIDWVLDSPRSFQIRVLQGLFDGDGWALVVGGKIGIASKVNTDFIEQLLLCVGIKPNREKLHQLSIQSQENIQKAAELPIFLSATEKLENINEILRMLDQTRSLGTPIDNLPLIRQIQDIGQDPRLSLGRIRLKIYKELGITLSPRTIGRIIDQGDERLKIDNDTVQIFFRLLELKQQYPTVPHSQLARRTNEETKNTINFETLRGWLRGNVPRDVKRALSDGYPLSQELLQAYPYLRQYLPKER